MLLLYKWSGHFVFHRDAECSQQSRNIEYEAEIERPVLSAPATRITDSNELSHRQADICNRLNCLKRPNFCSRKAQKGFFEMKTNNKKKFVMITAMFLMIALVIGMGAMTYARYTTTQDTNQQTATAAKWGVVITVTADKLFDKTYDNKVVATTNPNNDVIASAETTGNVVAPGTSGSMTITINGLTEVRAKLSFTEEGTTSDIYLDDYYPVKWSLTLNESAIDLDDNDGSDITSGTLEQLVAKLTEKTYNAGTSIDDTYTISWEWDLDTGNDDNEKAQNSVKDTAIGMLANGTSLDEVNTDLSTNYNASSHTISFQLKVTVEQIQE